MASIPNIASAKVLDIGCGDGWPWIFRFLKCGVHRPNVSGIDLLHGRLIIARKKYPEATFAISHGGALPFSDGRFDIVFASLLFSSVLNPDIRRLVASEMIRVRKPGGMVLLYDFHVNNPFNPDVRALKKAQIMELFSGRAISLRKVTLAPPLARYLSLPICRVLRRVSALKTHYLAVIEERG
jgi:ubiquinone/menaquinone biosynthesis C-methylase UbiE